MTFNKWIYYTLMVFHYLVLKIRSTVSEPVREQQKCSSYLSVSTHHHLFASKHDISGPLQAEDRNTINSPEPHIYSDCVE